MFLRVHPQVTHSVVQDALKEIGNGGQADVIFLSKWELANLSVEWIPSKKF